MEENITLRISPKRRRELIREAHKRDMLLKEYLFLLLNRKNESDFERLD